MHFANIRYLVTENHILHYLLVNIHILLASLYLLYYFKTLSYWDAILSKKEGFLDYLQN